MYFKVHTTVPKKLNWLRNCNPTIKHQKIGQNIQKGYFQYWTTGLAGLWHLGQGKNEVNVTIILDGVGFKTSAKAVWNKSLTISPNWKDRCWSSERLMWLYTLYRILELRQLHRERSIKLHMIPSPQVFGRVFIYTCIG